MSTIGIQTLFISKQYSGGETYSENSGHNLLSRHWDDFVLNVTMLWNWRWKLTVNQTSYSERELPANWGYVASAAEKWKFICCRYEDTLNFESRQNSSQIHSSIKFIEAKFWTTVATIIRRSRQSYNDRDNHTTIATIIRQLWQSYDDCDNLTTIAKIIRRSRQSYDDRDNHTSSYDCHNCRMIVAIVVWLSRSLYDCRDRRMIVATVVQNFASMNLIDEWICEEFCLDSKIQRIFVTATYKFLFLRRRGNIASVGR